LTWIEELTLKRNAQATNVYLVETMDFRRISQLKNMIMNGDFGKLTAIDSNHRLDHDLQQQKTWELPNLEGLTEEQAEKIDQQGRELPMDAVSPYAQIDKLLKGHSTICIIRFAILPVHAEMLANLIVPWSHDDIIYGRHSTVVIFTASLGLFNDNVRRLTHQIVVPPSSPEEREEALKKTARFLEEGMKKKYSQKIDITWNGSHIQAASGLTLHDVETAALESYFRHRAFDVRVFTDYKVRVLRNYGIEWVEPKRGFESVGGYDYLKQYVRQRVIKVLTSPTIAQKYGLEVPRGVLLFGPPGTGKTYFSKAIAKESNMPMLRISPADFLRGIVGETEARIRQLTQLIESMTPCIAFIDEFDQLALRRDTQFIGDSGVSRRMQNMLLDWLGSEERGSFVIGATNFIDLDPAFIRPGRIDEIILVLPPDTEARKQILQVHIGLRKTPVKDVDMAAIAGETYMWSGAELERLVKEASALAMERDAEAVTMDHFEESIKSFEVNADERMTNIKNMVDRMSKLEQVNQRFLTEALKAYTENESKVDSRVRGLLDSIGKLPTPQGGIPL